VTFRSDVFAWFTDGRVVQVSPGDGTYYFSEANVHPSGAAAIFQGGGTGPLRIWRADLSTFGLVPLTEAGTGATMPAYSWDGRFIAFASDRCIGQQRALTVERVGAQGPDPGEMAVNLYVMHADGEGVRQVTEGPYQDLRPSFSPDGDTIVFVSNRGGRPQIWTVPTDGSREPTQLQSKGWGFRPWFSADAASIYFFTNVDGRHGICRMSATDGSWTPLPNDDEGTSHGPFADVSGTTLLMHSTRGGGERSIWEVPLNGAPPQMLRPDGFDKVMMHGTRAANGTITFDSVD
jgi:TolB protein